MARVTAATATSALDALAEDLAAARFVPDADGAEDHEQILARARRLLDVKLRFEARRTDAAPPLVVIAGGTNVGKSTVFNWVVGEVVASSSPLARHTKAPTVFVHKGEAASLRNGAFLPSYARLDLTAAEDAAAERPEGIAYFLRLHDMQDVRGVVLIDSPDIDSTHDRNRAVAQDLLYLSDAVVFVATPEKYNDELCVRYLRQASELQKGLVCVLNKGADADVERDFRDVVVPGLEAREPSILTVPYVTPKPEPATEDGYRGILRDAVIKSGHTAGELRRLARRGACARLGQDLDAIGGRLREELSELARVRSEIDLVLQSHRDEYRRFLIGLDFYELDRVFERVLAYFRIPVLDTVYDGFRGAVSFVGSSLTKLVRGGQATDSRRAKLEARAEVDRQKAKELFESARGECLDVPGRHAGVLHGAVAGWVQSMEDVSIEDVNRDLETFFKKAAGESELWIERQTQKHVEMLDEHPAARNALRAMKGILQVGFGLLSAKLTGGFGPWDFLIGTATERATKLILETTGGKLHYQRLKQEFVDRRADLFLEELRAQVGEPLLARLPEPADPALLDRFATAAEALRAGEVPA